MYRERYIERERDREREMGTAPAAPIARVVAVQRHGAAGNARTYAQSAY